MVSLQYSRYPHQTAIPIIDFPSRAQDFPLPKILLPMVDTFLMSLYVSEIRVVRSLRPSLATMKREAAERASSDVPVNKSIITTRAQKAREASLSSTPSRVRTASDSVDPPTSTASTPSRGLRSRTALANAADKSASCGPLGSSVSQGPSSNLLILMYVRMIVALKDC